MARLAGAALSLLIGAAVVAAAALLVLVWRSAQGPVDVTWFVRQAAAHIGNPADPNRPRIGQVTVQWLVFDKGDGRPLQVDLRGSEIMGRGSAPSATLSHAQVLLSPAALLDGEVAPRAVVLDGLRLRLVRDQQGQVDLDDGTPAEPEPPAGSLSETIALLRRPVGAEAPGNGTSIKSILAQLVTVQVRDVDVAMQDRRLGTVLRLNEGGVNLRRQPGGGVLGSANLRLSVGDVSSSLTLRAELGEAGAGTHVTAALSPVSPAALARAAPGLAPLAPADTLIGASGTLDLSPGLAPHSAAVKAEAGAGRIVLPDASVPFEGVSLAATASWNGPETWRAPDRLDIGRAQAVVASPRGGWPTTIEASGQAVRDAAGIHADLTATLDHAAFADLPAMWPAVWGGHARPWLVDNLTSGTVRNGRFTATVQAAADGSGARLTAAEGTLLGDDVTIHWLRPVPPIEHAQTVLTLANPDLLEIAVSSARQGTAVLSNGMVRIKGLSVKDQDLALTADITSPVPELLTLLKHPRLHLLDRKPIPVQRPAGTMSATLRITMPLKHELMFEDLDIHAKGRFAGLRLGGLIAGRDLDRGDIVIDVTQDGLHAAGQATVGAVPAAVSVDMNFRNGGPADLVLQATAAGHATAKQLVATGLDFGSIAGVGQADFKVDYAAQRDGQASVQVRSDLREMALALAGWVKTPGQPAMANLQLVLRKDKLEGIRDLEAHGPDMDVRGRAEMVGDRPLRLVLDPIHLGPTRARGEILLPSHPGDPIRATLNGSVLDLAPSLSRPKPAPQSRSVREEPGTPFVADVRFDKVLLAKGQGIGSVTAHAESDGRRVNVLHAQSSGREAVRLSIVPRGSGRAISLRTGDAGGLAQALDLTDSVEGGTLVLEGRYDDSRADPPLSGNVALDNFHVRDAPGVGKFLQALTVYGIGEAMSGPGLLFSELKVPFRWESGVLTLQDARAFSASLGLTAEGRIDTVASTLDLRGTVIPAYVVNSALGRLPLIGKLFSPERGGGLVAVNYTYRGPIKNASVSVNPLSALTPGFMRRLFNIFD